MRGAVTVKRREERPDATERGPECADANRLRRVVGQLARQGVECGATGGAVAEERGELHACLERARAREGVRRCRHQCELGLRSRKLSEHHVEDAEVEVGASFRRPSVGPLTRDELCLAQVEQGSAGGVLPHAPRLLHREIPSDGLNEQRIRVTNDPRHVGPQVVRASRSGLDTDRDLHVGEDVEQMRERGVIARVKDQRAAEDAERAVPVASEATAGRVGRRLCGEVARVVLAVAESIKRFDVGRVVLDECGEGRAGALMVACRAREPTADEGTLARWQPSAQAGRGDGMRALGGRALRALPVHDDGELVVREGKGGIAIDGQQQVLARVGELEAMERCKTVEILAVGICTRGADRAA